MSKSKFPIRLKELRKEYDMTQADLAKKLGVVRTAVANYETERTMPDNESLQLMAKLFNVSIDYLLGVTNDKRKNNNQTEDLSEEQILTMAAHKVGHDGPLSDIDMSMIRKAIKIALDK